MDTKDNSAPALYRQGYERGVAAGKAEADRWWAERIEEWARCMATAMLYPDYGWAKVGREMVAKEMAVRAEEVLGEQEPKA